MEELYIFFRYRVGVNNNPGAICEICPDAGKAATFFVQGQKSLSNC